MTIYPTSPRREDAASIYRIVADIEQGFNDNDPKKLVRHIAPDALIVNPFGMVMRGPDEVEASVRPLVERGPLKDVTAYYRLTDIAQVGPDAVVAQKSAWSSKKAADHGDRPEMTSLYVFAKRDGTWWIIRRQNTTVGS